VTQGVEGIGMVAWSAPGRLVEVGGRGLVEGDAERSRAARGWSGS